MRHHKPRKLSAQEKDLWRKATEKAAPLKASVPAARPDAPAITVRKPHQSAPMPFRIGAKANPPAGAHDLAPGIDEVFAASPVTMDRNRYTKLKKGRLAPEARIDLHGMTLAQAHPALARFILDATARGLRLVLVITGKGKRRSETGPIPQPVGALRHQVPHWLNASELRRHVLQISPAHVRHGGEGAYYVYLRRDRQKGTVPTRR